VRVRLVDDPRAEVGEDVRVGVGVGAMECRLYSRPVTDVRSVIAESDEMPEMIGQSINRMNGQSSDGQPAKLPAVAHTVRLPFSRPECQQRS